LGGHGEEVFDGLNWFLIAEFSIGGFREIAEFLEACMCMYAPLAVVYLPFGR
jgi:hypothetical protein